MLTCSHVILASDDVPRISGFFCEAFDVPPHYENDMFADFVLPSRFRVAFFKPVGASARSFRAEADRDACAFGATVADVDLVYGRLVAMSGRFPDSVERSAQGPSLGRRASSDRSRWQPLGDHPVAQRRRHAGEPALKCF
jgi:hypothetical protein